MWCKSILLNPSAFLEEKDTFVQHKVGSDSDFLFFLVSSNECSRRSFQYTCSFNWPELPWTHNNFRLSLKLASIFNYLESYWKWAKMSYILRNFINFVHKFVQYWQRSHFCQTQVFTPRYEAQYLSVNLNSIVN